MNANNIFDTDFQDFIQALNCCEVAYILVGGKAVILHGYSRSTGDMDIWVERTAANYDRLMRSFAQFGFPTNVILLTDFMRGEPFDVFTFGRSPIAIDVMLAVKGLEFEAAFANAIWYDFDDFRVRYLRLDDLLTAKRAAGRYKDLDDIEHLEK